MKTLISTLQVLVFLIFLGGCSSAYVTPIDQPTANLIMEKPTANTINILAAESQKVYILELDRWGCEVDRQTISEDEWNEYGVRVPSGAEIGIGRERRTRDVDCENYLVTTLLPGGQYELYSKPGEQNCEIGIHDLADTSADYDAKEMLTTRRGGVRGSRLCRP